MLSNYRFQCFVLFFQFLRKRTNRKARDYWNFVVQDKVFESTSKIPFPVSRQQIFQRKTVLVLDVIRNCIKSTFYIFRSTYDEDAIFVYNTVHTCHNLRIHLTNSDNVTIFVRNYSVQCLLERFPLGSCCNNKRCFRYTN
jgi:hypothetical protein